LGVFPNPEYRTGEVTLNPGDMVVLYTDGVTEIDDEQGRRFGSDGLAVIAHQFRSQPVEALAEEIVSLTKRYAGTRGYRDDFTLVLLRRSV
jgi:sigma-B regulation protein RsbU (phosphoserine phosphatase)